MAAACQCTEVSTEPLPPPCIYGPFEHAKQHSFKKLYLPHVEKPNFLDAAQQRSSEIVSDKNIHQITKTIA